MTHLLARNLEFGRRLFLAAAGSATLALSQAPTPAARPEFEVASIKPSAGGPGRFLGTDRSGDLNTKNMPLRALIAEAYRVKGFQIYGAPGWISSDMYDIVAKREVSPKDGRARNESFEKRWADLMLRLQVLLEDRCNLKVHHETKELPVFTLTVAKGGLKLQPSKCVTVDPEHPPALPPPGQPRPAFCGNLGIGKNGLNSTLTGYGITMKDLAGFWLQNATGRTVIDKTGYTGTFNASLEWTPDAALGPPGPDDGKPAPPLDATGPSIFTALQEQLGLKLESTKGPVEVLVIDHVEKPSAN